MDLKTLASKKVRPPRIKGAVGWVEAVLVEEIPRKDYVLVIGKAVYAEKGDPENGTTDHLPLVLLGDRYLIPADEVRG